MSAKLKCTPDLQALISSTPRLVRLLKGTFRVVACHAPSLRIVLLPRLALYTTCQAYVIQGCHGVCGPNVFRLAFPLPLTSMEVNSLSVWIQTCRFGCYIKSSKVSNRLSIFSNLSSISEILLCIGVMEGSEILPVGS